MINLSLMFNVVSVVLTLIRGYNVFIAGACSSIWPPEQEDIVGQTLSIVSRLSAPRSKLLILKFANP